MYPNCAAFGVMAAPSRFIQKEEEDGTDVPNAGPTFPI
jgi:hypothetical protein